MPMHAHRAELLDAAVEAEGVRARYWSKVHTAGEHWWWTGAIMRTGHGRFWLGRDGDTDVVVLAHRFGYALAHGVDALIDAPVLRHGCDEALCQRPEHLAPSDDDHDNRLEWMLRRHRIGSPHRDVRGASGRARAIRAAVLGDGDVAQALRDGQPALDALQPTLF